MFLKNNVQFIVHHNDITIVINSSSVLWFVLAVGWIKCKFMKLCAQFFIWFFQMINFSFWLTNGLKERAVSLFTGKELPDHFLNISNLCCSLDIFESFVNLGWVSHFLLHSLAHICVPQLLSVEIFAHLELRWVFVFVSCCFSNFSIFSLAFDSTRYWSFFVLDTFLKFKNAFLAIFLFKLDVLHKVVKDCFGL